MPVVRAADAVTHDMHGSRFHSYAAPKLGSKELCAWRLEVPPGNRGVPHAVTREEVLFVLAGTLHVSLSDAPDAVTAVPAGDAVVVHPGSRLRVDNLGDEPASAWVTTSAGLEAVLADGSRLDPPWTR
jgi:quercetin dioxygenase-like cupin family protein